MNAWTHRLLVICIVFFGFSTAGVMMRVWSMRIKRRPFSIDDFLILWAYVGSHWPSNLSKKT